MGDEEPRALPETKALLMIREVYQEENKLKEMAADERLFCERGASLNCINFIVTMNPPAHVENSTDPSENDSVKFSLHGSELLNQTSIRKFINYIVSYQKNIAFFPIE
ncbi:MAG: hypothetical protein K2O06_01355 [Acetatifactor sp.]|nr:hypothetical protein [Acetatifactor sp.]